MRNYIDTVVYCQLCFDSICKILSLSLYLYQCVCVEVGKVNKRTSCVAVQHMNLPTKSNRIDCVTKIGNTL